MLGRAGQPAQKSPFAASWIAGGTSESLLHTMCPHQSKNCRDGGEWWISPLSSCSPTPWLGVPNSFSSLPWARWGAARRHLLLLHCCQYPLLPTLSPRQHFKSGRSDKAGSEPSSPCGFQLPHSSHWCYWELFPKALTLFLLRDMWITWRSSFGPLF